jgi:hypothetical protein
MTPDQIEEVDRGLFLLPAHLREGMRRYLVERVPTGDFLRAVLENDHMQAVGRADPLSRDQLHFIATFLNLHAPANAHGSPEAVAAWLSAGKAGA